MLQQVTVLLSFVYAIAITHLLTSSTELVWARDRVRFSGRQALWMLSALLSTVNNWLALSALNTVKHWNAAALGSELGAAILQYYVCSLISIHPPENGIVEMSAFYDKQRPPFFLAYLALCAYVIVQDLWSATSAWDGALVVNVAYVFLLLIAGWSRPRWLQWAAGLLTFGLQAFFLVTFSVVS